VNLSAHKAGLAAHVPVTILTGMGERLDRKTVVGMEHVTEGI
jgi:hypothetical protein